MGRDPYNNEKFSLLFHQDMLTTKLVESLASAWLTLGNVNPITVVWHPFFLTNMYDHLSYIPRALSTDIL